MEKLVTTVTQANINSGQPCEPRACPLAHALRDATDLEWHVESEAAFLIDETGACTSSMTHLTEKAKRFIDLYDESYDNEYQGPPALPFTTTLYWQPPASWRKPEEKP